MITCGKDIPLGNNITLPDVSVGVSQFLQNIRVGIVQSTQVDGLTQDIVKWQDSMACIQPMAEKLAMAKEGERSWRWFSIYATPDLVLATDDIIVVAGTSYKIMEKVGWQQYGYIEYQAIEWYRKYEN